MRARVVTDELDSIVRMLCEKYRGCREDEIAELVHGVYGKLAAEATVTDHLIPLTVHRCHEVLKRRNIRSGKVLRPAVR